MVRWTCVLIRLYTLIFVCHREGTHSRYQIYTEQTTLALNALQKDVDFFDCTSLWKAHRRQNLAAVQIITDAVRLLGLRDMYGMVFIHTRNYNSCGFKAFLFLINELFLLIFFFEAVTIFFFSTYFVLNRKLATVRKYGYYVYAFCHNCHCQHHGLQMILLLAWRRIINERFWGILEPNISIRKKNF